MTQLCMYALDISQSSKRGGNETQISRSFTAWTCIFSLTSSSASTTEGATTTSYRVPLLD